MRDRVKGKMSCEWRTDIFQACQISLSWKTGTYMQCVVLLQEALPTNDMRRNGARISHAVSDVGAHLT